MHPQKSNERTGFTGFLNLAPPGRDLVTDGLLVIGADGLLGSSLHAMGRTRGWPVEGTTRKEVAAGSGLHYLDLGKPIDDYTPPHCTTAVLCAAVTRLEACRREPVATRYVNVEQTIRLARRLHDQGIFVTYLSSNLVFDGTCALQQADAPLRPNTEYGRQKAAAEEGIGRLGDKAAIVRLTKVVSPQWQLLRGWSDDLRRGKPVNPFSNKSCAPIPPGLTVQGIAEIARRKLPGIWQFSPATDVTYADIARDIARRIGANPELVRPLQAPAEEGSGREPRFGTLDATRAQLELTLTFPPPLEAIAQTFQP